MEVKRKLSDVKHDETTFKQRAEAPRTLGKSMSRRFNESQTQTCTR